MRKTLICFMIAAIIAVYIHTPVMADTNNYTVNQGDNLFRISLKTGASVAEIKQVNSLNNFNIHVGQVLQIPTSANMATYMVQAGDNLYRIALRHNKTVSEIKAANGLANDVIKEGQKLVIPGSTTIPIADKMPVENQVGPEPVKKKENTPLPAGNSSTEAVSKKLISEDDKLLLAHLIYAEARGETQEGKTAVGAVILNRLKSPQFPKSIRNIIFQKRGSVYQFSPVQNGSINMEPDTEAFKAADEALQGKDPTEGALFFYNPEKTDDQWIRTLPDTHRIGNHVFAK